jgi:hypothetical protein
MNYKSERKKEIEKLINHYKVVTIEDLKNTLNTNYSMTVFRYLKEIGYLSSYNNAGKFYTMPHIPKFDEYGLWHYEAASFSKLGTLKSTILSTINDSHEGFTHRELKQLLRSRVQNTLSDLTKNKVISRESVNGRFVYVSATKEEATLQISRRKKKSVIVTTQQSEIIEFPIIIEILLELLRSSVWDAKIISKNLNIRKVPATEQQIDNVLRRYNLKKKL